MPGHEAAVRIALEDSAATLEATVSVSDIVARAAQMLIDALKDGKRVLACGNGGSAADAQRLAAELVGRFEAPRVPLPAVALATDPATVTALANDFGFDEVFVRQVRALSRPGDVLVAISTNGRAPNIVHAAEWAHEHGVRVIALTGEDGAELAQHADVHVAVPAKRAVRVEEAHGAIVHAMCEAIDLAFAERTPR